jgi:hypothetical protein
VRNGFLRNFLAASGYDVVEAVDGGEAMAKAVDDYGSTRQIKADPNLKAMPLAETMPVG